MKGISIVVPVYNAGPFLRKAIESLLIDTSIGIEIVVVDDGSTDNGIKTIEDLPVRVLRQENKGEAAARNAGVKATTQPFVTFLDADDVMSPGSLSARLDHFRSHPEDSVVGGFPSRLIDENGQVLAEVFNRMPAKYTFPFRLDESVYRAQKFFPVSCSLYLYRSDIFERVGFFDETLAVAPDCDFHFRILQMGSIPILKIPVFDRRIHKKNLSLSVARSADVSFRPEIIETVQKLNRKYGYEVKEIRPWELDYL